MLLTGCFLAFIPSRKKDSFTLKPGHLAHWAASDTSSFTADEVARMIVNEVPGITLIDIRSGEDFNTCRLPAAMHIPFSDLLNPANRELLNRRTGKNIFYSNGDEISAAALTLTTGLGYPNCYRLKGGLNGWYEVVMNASFTGDRITASENALFGTRADAGRLFTEYNSLPDSLKPKLFVSRQLATAKLDGGCE